MLGSDRVTLPISFRLPLSALPSLSSRIWEGPHFPLVLHQKFDCPPAVLDQKRHLRCDELMRHRFRARSSEPAAFGSCRMAESLNFFSPASASELMTLIFIFQEWWISLWNTYIIEEIFRRAIHVDIPASLLINHD